MTATADAEAGAREAGAPWLTFAAAVLTALGVLVVAGAYAAARQEVPWAGGAYWAGMALIVLPVVGSAISMAPSRSQRLALALLLALALYGVKVLHGPLQFEFHDELQHWRTTVDIATTGELFTHNPLLPISPFFPGLEITAHAVMAVTGVSVELAGTIVIGLAKLLGAAALFWLFERVTGSGRLAMLATLVYASNPHFTFFTSMYSYGSLALPLMILALVLLHRWTTRAGLPSAGSYRVATMATLAALTVTHHLTAFVALGLLLLWNLVTIASNREGGSQLPPLEAFVFLLAALVGWHLAVGADSLGYLGAVLSRAADALTASGDAVTTAPPLDRPAWEWAVSAATVGLVSLAIPVGAWRVWNEWRRGALDALAVVLTVLAGVYYLGIVARFLPGGAELAGRAWSFTYLGAALPITLAFARLFLSRPLASRRWLLVPVLALLFLGGSAMGYPPHWGRLPGPYLVSAFERSIEPEGIAAATWQADHFGRNGRVTTDATNATLSGSYGFQEPVLGALQVYFAPTVRDEEVDALRSYAIDRLLVDLRLCQDTPRTGYYVHDEEPGAYRYDRPLDCSLLTKFDDAPGFRRMYDGGSIRIYDLALQEPASAGAGLAEGGPVRKEGDGSGG